MEYYIYYITFAFIALLFNKPMTIAILLFGAVVDELSEAWFEYFNQIEAMQHSPNIFYAVLFMLYVAWFIVFDALKIKHSTIAVGLLSLYTGVMFFDATASPENETIFYTSYPVIISILNALIIMAGFYDNRNISLANIGRVLSNNKKNHGANL